MHHLLEFSKDVSLATGISMQFVHDDAPTHSNFVVRGDHWNYSGLFLMGISKVIS